MSCGCGKRWCFRQPLFWLFSVGTRLIPSKDVSGIDLIFDIIQDGIVAVGDDVVALALELIEVVHDRIAEVGGAVVEGGLIDDDGCALVFEALHDALNGRLAEVVGAGLHGEAVYSDGEI